MKIHRFAAFVSVGISLLFSRQENAIGAAAVSTRNLRAASPGDFQQGDDEESSDDGRILLPSHVVPQRYDLAIEPDMEAFTFKGSVEITMTLDKSKLSQENAKTIALNARELAFREVSYSSPSTGAVPAVEVNNNLKDMTVTFVFDTPLTNVSESSIKLNIAYSGILNNQMDGFFRLNYNDIDGTQKVVAATQFQPVGARRAFPCVDEPAAKAVFALNLTIPSNQECVSNMPVSSKESLSLTKTKCSFLDSPIMSTYLVAFSVGKFDSVQAVTKSGVMVRTLTSPGKTGKAKFGHDIAVRSLELFGDFFDLPYTLPKLDNLILDEMDWAMENWGLVTYLESGMLLDPLEATSSQAQRTAVFVTHENAHMWFGNLVTMKWWDDLWLNEGFASWAEYWATDELFPEFYMWDQFTVDNQAWALELDGLKSSHPVKVPIPRAEEVDQIFDDISYSKASALVRMIELVLGIEAMRDGLRLYISNHAHSNTQTSDLWEALEAASGLPVGEMMETWTLQTGYPYLQVISEDWQGDSVTVELEQNWFLADGSALDEEGDAKKWTIPIVFSCRGANDTSNVVFMREKKENVTLVQCSTGEEEDGASSWLKLNAGQGVPMRILYTQDMLIRMSNAIRSKSIPVSDRAGLINDAYFMVGAGHMEPESLIRLLVDYQEEDTYVTWDAMATVLLGLHDILSNNPIIEDYLTRFVRPLVLDLNEKVGWEANESDDHLTGLLRRRMIRLLSAFAYDVPAVATEAATRFRTFMDGNKSALPPDIREFAFQIVLKNGGKTEYDEIRSLYVKTGSDNDRRPVMSSLGATPDLELKRACLTWSTSGEIATRDMPDLMGSVRGSVDGREMRWNFFKDNFVVITTLATEIPALMRHIINSCAGGFASDEKADEIEAFFQTNPVPSESRAIAQLVEATRANARFLERLSTSDLAQEDFWSNL